MGFTKFERFFKGFLSVGNVLFEKQSSAIWKARGVLLGL